MASASRDITSGSDSVFDIECQQCSRMRNNNEAERFCTDCREYFCKRCSAYHQVLPVTKDHELVSVEEARNRIIPGLQVETSSDEVASLDTTQDAFVPELHAGSRSDEYDCWNTGLAMMANNKLLIADRHNQKLKVLDTVRNRLESELSLHSGPLDVAKISTNTAVVTLPDKARWLFVKTSPRLSVLKDNQWKGEITGVAYSESRRLLAVSFLMPPKVEIWNVIHDADNISVSSVRILGRDFFRRPTYVAFSAASQALFVSETADGKNAVLKVDVDDGTLLTTYTDTMLGDPNGIVACRNGRVYVATNTSRIYVIYPVRGRMQEILSEEERGRIYAPFCLTSNEREDRLYVGVYNKSSIIVFRLD